MALGSCSALRRKAESNPLTARQNRCWRPLHARSRNCVIDRSLVTPFCSAGVPQRVPMTCGQLISLAVMLILVSSQPIVAQEGGDVSHKIAMTAEPSNLPCEGRSSPGSGICQIYSQCTPCSTARCFPVL